MPKKYWYVILTYVLAQLSGIIVGPIVKVLNIDLLNASVAWSIISFVLALIIIMYL